MTQMPPSKTKEKVRNRNISGRKIAYLRKNLKEKPSQQKFAEMLQLSGLNVDKNTVQQWESGERSIKDIQIKVIAEVLNVTPNDLILSTNLKED